MYQAIITNINTGQIWEGTFQTEAEAQTWVDAQVLKPWRNITASWYNESILTQEQINTSIDSRYIEVSDDVYIRQYQLPAQATYSITDISSEVAKKEARDTQKNNGNILRELCYNVLCILSGYSSAENFTTEQINTFRTQYATIIEYLKAGMAVPAKTLIDAVAVDGVIVKQTLVDSVNLEYSDYYSSYPEIFT